MQSSPKADALFGSEQYALAYPPGVENHWWHVARHHMIYKTLCSINADDDPMLEVGCGKGIVTKFLRKKGCPCTGIEPAKQGATADSSDDGVIRGQEISNLDATFRQTIKTILLLDVLEHIEDPKSFLSNLTTFFPNACHLVITVPACKAIWSNYDEFYGHHRRYDLEMLQNLATEIGSQIVQLRYAFQCVLPIVLMQTKLKKKRSLQTKAPLSKSAKLLHQTVAQVMKWDFALAPKKLPGTSAICVMRICPNKNAASITQPTCATPIG